jgi:hypothetical protein
MGSAEDYRNEGLRRLIVNAMFWCLGMEKQVDPPFEPRNRWRLQTFEQWLRLCKTQCRAAQAKLLQVVILSR